MSREALKDKVLDAIDGLASEIIEIGEAVWRSPELGFKELKTSMLVEKKYEEYGWRYEGGISITGSKAYLGGIEARPNIGIIGELDAVRCPDHPECDPITGAVHACGHHAQLANMLGAGMGLYESGALERLGGNVTMLAVPAEEYLEIEYRSALRERGEITFFGGKQEFIRLGALEDVDISLGTHSISDPEFKGRLGVGGSNNGFIGKLVRYRGLEAHAGAEPHRGVNALNAALLGLMGIHAQRETFRDEDSIRVHPIITKGGEIVNNVPADVRIEAYVRGRTIEAIMDANMKVNRALRAGASAVGATVEINDIPGYMPYTQELNLVELIKRNGESTVGKEWVEMRGHSTGSTDLGDVSCVMPTASLGMGGVEGAGHSRSFRVVDRELLYVTPAKVLALTCVDLLYDGAGEARRIIDSFKPKISKKDYTRFMTQLFG
jgi:amidohydrolase